MRAAALLLLSLACADLAAAAVQKSPPPKPRPPPPKPLPPPKPSPPPPAPRPPPPSPPPPPFSYRVNGGASSSAPVSTLLSVLTSNKAAKSLAVVFASGSALTASALGAKASPLLNLVLAAGHSLSLACAAVTSPPSCSLSGSNQYSLITVAGAGSLSLVGLALTGGLTATGGAALHASGGANVTTAGVVFSRNVATGSEPHSGSYGGAVFLSGGTFAAVNTTFSNNTAGGKPAEGCIGHVCPSHHQYPLPPPPRPLCRPGRRSVHVRRRQRQPGGRRAGRQRGSGW